MKTAFLLLTFCLVMVSVDLLIAQENQSEDPKNQPNQQDLPSIYDSVFVASSDQKAVRFLALEKGGRKKRIKFFVGEEITIKLIDDKKKYKVTIQDIKEDVIVVKDTELNIKEIRSITMDNSKNNTPLLQTATTYLPIAGLGYILLDVIDFAALATSTVLIGGTLFVGGLLLNLLKKRKFRLGKKRYLKTVRAIE